MLKSSLSGGMKGKNLIFKGMEEICLKYEKQRKKKLM
jgi:hypothetical protein